MTEELERWARRWQEPQSLAARHRLLATCPSSTVRQNCAYQLQLVDNATLERQVERKALKPLRRERKVRGATQKRRGYQAERLFVDKYLGPRWERVPLSGALGGNHRGDVRFLGNPAAPVPAVRLGEIKRREGAFVQWRRFLSQGGGMDFVGIVPGNGAEPLVVCTATTWKRLLEAAGNA